MNPYDNGNPGTGFASVADPKLLISDPDPTCKVITGSYLSGHYGPGSDFSGRFGSGSYSYIFVKSSRDFAFSRSKR